MRLTLLIVLTWVPFVLADDWEDFTNNLATDLVSSAYSSEELQRNIEDEEGILMYNLITGPFNHSIRRTTHKTILVRIHTPH